MLNVNTLLCLGLLTTAGLTLPHKGDKNSRNGVLRTKIGTTVLNARQASGAVCGSDTYNSANIAAAQKQGCALENSGKTLGKDKYPHQYNDDEGFNFTTTAPWYEFPVMENHQVYSGESPGADRVIFNKACLLSGVITHSGATGDDFVMCKYDGQKFVESEAWGM